MFVYQNGILNNECTILISMTKYIKNPIYWPQSKHGIQIKEKWVMLELIGKHVRKCENPQQKASLLKAHVQLLYTKWIYWTQKHLKWMNTNVFWIVRLQITNAPMTHSTAHTSKVEGPWHAGKSLINTDSGKTSNDYSASLTQYRSDGVDLLMCALTQGVLTNRQKGRAINTCTNRRLVARH